MYAWTYLQARRGFWLERFFWNKELEKSCVELAAVAWYGLGCQFSRAQPLTGVRQELCWAGSWVTSEVSLAWKEAVYLPRRFGVCMQAGECIKQSIWLKWKHQHEKELCFSETIFLAVLDIPIFFLFLKQYRNWKKRTTSFLLMLSSACGWKAGPGFSFHSRFEKSVSHAIKSDWILEVYLNFT